MLPETRLTITTASGTLRRALVPSAWLVLEELALEVDADGVASTSARRLATALGLSKDTTARALKTLIELRLVERIENRDEMTGRFGAIRYRVDTKQAGLVVHAPRSPRSEVTVLLDTNRATEPTRVSTRRPSPQAVADRDQLELFGH